MRARIAFVAAGLGLAAAVLPLHAAEERPLAELPYTPGLDPTAMDHAVDPCVDFYQYSCGGWMRANPIPADQSSWSVYGKLAQENQRYLWGILEQLAQGGAERNAAQQKAGDYFAACMDEAAAAERGAQPLHQLYTQIDALRTRHQLGPMLATLHTALADAAHLFSFGSGQDFADSTQVIAFASAGGLGLPDRDYYLKRDAKSRQLRADYQRHVARTLRLAGLDEIAAVHGAQIVMRIETALARASLTAVEKRDPHRLHNSYDLVRLRRLMPNFDWHGYLSARGQTALGRINVTEPRFFRALDGLLKNTALDDLKTYLRWHVAATMSPWLSDEFVGAHFDFFGRTLHGVEQLKPRWKRCVELVDAQLGEALGQEFVARAFSPELKAQTVRMTEQIKTAMGQAIEGLDWMSAQTKARAREKLAAVANKVGYPERWRDYSSFSVRRDDFVGNVLRGNTYEQARQLAKIGKPVDRSDWLMTPPTVNAYYDPQMNDINFPAGILQPPLYDPKMDDAPNYGNTGGTIGHELTHGFDDEGRKFDAQGNLKNWWTRRDGRAFERRAQCVVDQYAQYTVVDEVKINSRLTLGEDVADLGGLLLSWMAWQMQIKDVPPVNRDGLSPEQRFFVGFAQWACENQRPETLRVQAATDPHSPGKYRVNGIVANSPEFAKAFSCKNGQPMVREKPCKVW